MRAMRGHRGFGLVATFGVVITVGLRTQAATPLIERLEAGQHQTVVVYGTSLTAGGAWVTQLSASLNATYPGQITWVNAALSGRASNSGLANLTNLVLSQHPDAVFIEFGMNDAFTAYPAGDADFGITPQHSKANLNAMIDGVLQQNPAADIVLQTMNPAWDAPNGNQSGTKRPQLADYYQGYRDVATARGLTLVDNDAVWQKQLANSPSVFQAYVADGTHPNAAGYGRLVTPAIRWTLGAETGLTLLIDPTTGRAVLNNQSSSNLELISYTISSPGGALRTTWDSFSRRGNAAWLMANPTARSLSELNPTNIQSIPAGAFIGMGHVWNVSGALDVDFLYQSPDGATHAGSVVYTDDVEMLALPGDFDGDGAVTGDDFLRWQRMLGATVAPFSDADDNGDGAVDRRDLDAWLGSFGAPPVVETSLKALPEPSANMMGAVAAIVLALRRADP